MNTDHKKTTAPHSETKESGIRPLSNAGLALSKPGINIISAPTKLPRATGVVSPIIPGSRTNILLPPKKKITPPVLASKYLLDYRINNHLRWGLAARTNFVANKETIKPVNILGDPIHIGQYFIWPDRKRKQLFFHLAKPLTLDFSLSVEKENTETVRTEGGLNGDIEGGQVDSQEDTIRTKGGRAVLSLGMYQENAKTALETMRAENHPQLSDFTNWPFQQISLKNIKVKLVGSDEEIQGMDVSISNEAGSIIFLIDLTETGADNWHNLIRDRRMSHIQGICDLTFSFYAKDGEKVQAKKVDLNVPLSHLLSSVSLEHVHVTDPVLSLRTNIHVQGHPIIQNVTVDYKPSQGHQPKSFQFDKSGGDATATITGTDLEDLSIELLHKVDFDQLNWPVIRERKLLTYRNNNWSEVIDPGSWMTRYTLMVFLMDEDGKVISGEDVDPANRVICELVYQADYLAGSGSIINVLETQSETIEEIHFPKPEGEQPGRLKLSVTALRTSNGRGISPVLQTRNLDASATTIIVQVWPDGRLDIITNEDAISERSLEDEMFNTLQELYAGKSEVQSEGQSRPAESESGFYVERTTPEFHQLMRYLKIDEATFSESEPWYFPELEHYLIHQGILSEFDLLDRNNFHNAVAEFQSRNDLGVDGIPGQNTLWKLQLPYVQDHPVSIRRVEADRVPGYEEGYNSFRLREDAAFYYEGLREEVQHHGGVITSSGSLRSLSAQVTPGRSAKSMHYTGIAFDLYIHSGMRNPRIDPYIITENGRKWTVYCRVPYGGAIKALDALVWKNGRVSKQSIVARVINFTELAAAYGFYNISRRSCFPYNYLCAEWWHFQNEYVMTPYVSLFGMEVLRLDRVNYNRLRYSPLWPNRKHIFKRDWF